MPQPLTAELLQRLEDAWRTQGAEIADVLAPGLDDGEMDALVRARLGVSLPAEARRWWGWHDGVSVQTPYGRDLGAYIGFYSLRQALAVLDDPLAGGGEEAPPTWLPIAQAPGGPICIDCADPEIAVVHRVDHQVGFHPGAASMGEMVQLWLQMYETGAWSWSPQVGRWDRNLDRAPAKASEMYVI